ncbi:glucan endo-1,3-beta-glucosidase 11-like [Coffea eugenioides]|uniref:glucan endo-1,3-beta-glucosidase 11-like n=1 Tax=Coffea eugenioides TaxID=49369 RepID=UPI000F60B067|nr:glucan endo-1,3-beta-glucosidase 11-like [Coffea eugenioides]
MNYAELSPSKALYPKPYSSLRTTYNLSGAQRRRAGLDYGRTNYECFAKLNSFRIPLFALYLDDPATNLHYDNMLFAQIDAVHFAVESLGFKDDAVCVQISETGWPSKGDTDEAGATPENAKKYNGNLINKLVCGKKGTPMRPNADLNIYVFALFNENMKSSPTSERNYGLFKPDDSSAYYIGFNSTGLLSTSSNTSTTPSSTGSSSSSSSSVPLGSSSSSGSTTSSTAVVVS